MVWSSQISVNTRAREACLIVTSIKGSCKPSLYHNFARSTWSNVLIKKGKIDKWAYLNACAVGSKGDGLVGVLSESEYREEKKSQWVWLHLYTWDAS